ncbi:MAG: 2,3-bisphosphoglycerate-independent phosphoglycerate mutase [Clostridia bacterium]|nr:2,3-bisphosphoglycerate-independent phosphoglycerate mutase [Clostridia bacterium]
MAKKPLALVIMDGYGMTQDSSVSAISKAKTPNMDKYLASYPYTQLNASGLAVGLPEGQMGNSEVGHTNIGAGRVVYQELTRITKSIEDGDFFENPALKTAMENCKKNGSKLHLIGLLSNGGVHSHNTHLYALVKMAKKYELSDVNIHCLLDGRDVPPNSAEGFVAELEKQLKEIGVGKIATISGRYYGMDRDNRWERVEKAYNAIALAEGEQADDAVTAVTNSYAGEVFDEFVLPTVICGGAKVEENDSIVFFNFRPDRAREITRCFVDTDFNGFERKTFNKVYYVCMTQYDASMPNVDIAFKPQQLVNTLGEYLSKQGLSQLRIAETEKYAHVTFFFNGGVEKVYEGEDRALIPSPKVATYDLQPEMSAYLVTEEVLKRIESDKYDVIILNFANCDMVGHTGIMDAAIKAVETVDECLGKVVDAITAKGGALLITADHGNADCMQDTDGGPFTAHTTNPVPLVMIGYEGKLHNGGLSDLAPTMLTMMGLEVPQEMSGKSLID